MTCTDADADADDDDYVDDDEDNLFRFHPKISVGLCCLFTVYKN